MFDDEWERDEIVARHLANKIKCCRQCGTELDYKEKFNYTDKICNACKGLPPFEDAVKPQESQVVEDTDNSLSHLPLFEQKLYSKYPERRSMIEKAEKEWKEKHGSGSDPSFNSDT